MNIEDALIERTIKDLGDGKVEITEKWDVRHPDCLIGVLDENVRTVTIKTLHKSGI